MFEMKAERQATFVSGFQKQNTVCGPPNVTPALSGLAKQHRQDGGNPGTAKSKPQLCVALGDDRQ